MKRSTLLQRVKELKPDIAERELFARILCGEIMVNGETIRSPREPIPADAVIHCKPHRRFVSRGGDKLDGVLQRWSISVAGLSLLDAGSSTGGFTDCLLQRGARAVLAVEKGYNQLDFRLRRDDRVNLLEKTNIMDLRTQTLPFPLDAAVADLSLRSLRSAAAHILSLFSGGWLIALVKPQYERTGLLAHSSGAVCGREEVLQVLRALVLALGEEGLQVLRGAPSPVAGAKGNREFFLQICRSRGTAGRGLVGLEITETLEALVAEAFP